MIEALSEALRASTAKRVQLNWPVSVTARHLSQSSGAIWSIAPVGPAIPALLIRQSSPPSSASAVSNSAATAFLSETSQTLDVMSGSDCLTASRASRSTSQI